MMIGCFEEGGQRVHFVMNLNVFLVSVWMIFWITGAFEIMGLDNFIIIVFNHY
jgi:hypothetical protein